MDDANAEVNDTVRLWLHRGCPGFGRQLNLGPNIEMYLDVFKTYVDMISFYTLCIHIYIHTLLYI